jgi:hypothetical protein
MPCLLFLRCMELHKVQWRTKAGTYTARVSSSTSISFLYLWSRYVRGFPQISKVSHSVQQNSSLWCTVFYVCLLRFELLPFSFRYCRQSSSSFVILKTRFSLLLLADAPHLPDAFRLLIMCAKKLISLEKSLLHWNRFCLNLWQFIKLNMCFQWVRAFAVVFLYRFFLPYCSGFVRLVFFYLYFCVFCFVSLCSLYNTPLCCEVCTLINWI